MWAVFLQQPSVILRIFPIATSLSHDSPAHPPAPQSSGYSTTSSHNIWNDILPWGTHKSNKTLTKSQSFTTYTAVYVPAYRSVHPCSKEWTPKTDPCRPGVAARRLHTIISRGWVPTWETAQQRAGIRNHLGWSWSKSLLPEDLRSTLKPWGAQTARHPFLTARCLASKAVTSAARAEATASWFVLSGFSLISRVLTVLLLCFSDSTCH